MLVSGRVYGIHNTTHQESPRITSHMDTKSTWMSEGKGRRVSLKGGKGDPGHIPSIWFSMILFKETWPGGGFKYLFCSSRNLGKWFPIWRAFFADGLVQPPTRYDFLWFCLRETWFLLAYIYRGAGVQPGEGDPVSGSVQNSHSSPLPNPPPSGSQDINHFFGRSDPFIDPGILMLTNHIKAGWPVEKKGG